MPIEKGRPPSQTPGKAKHIVGKRGQKPNWGGSHERFPYSNTQSIQKFGHSRFDVRGHFQSSAINTTNTAATEVRELQEGLDRVKPKDS